EGTTPRVFGILKEVEERPDPPREGLARDELVRQALIELEGQQAAEVGEWRLKQGFFLGLPALLVGGVVTWVGLQALRRARLEGTVFAANEEAARGQTKRPEDRQSD